MADRKCQRCGKTFQLPYLLQRHQARKTPCEPILDTPREAGGDPAHRCKYCGRAFASKQSAYRHMRQSCKIANTDEGMEKLMDHTLQKQMAEMEARMKMQMAEMMQLLKGQVLVPAMSGAGGGSAIVNGSVTVQQTQQMVQQIHIEKVEIHPWDRARAVMVGVPDIAAAFAENTRLQEYARFSDQAMTDKELAPPYVADLLIDLVKRGHADPASRNIYLNPRRADQVLVQLKRGTWEVRSAEEGYRALLDGVALSMHQVTLVYENRKQLPPEAQNALAMAGLMYDDEPEAYVKLARGALAAHLTNLAPVIAAKR
jgi:hypothetical protein